MAQERHGIRYANLDTSKRLQRLMNHLSDLKEHTTMDIVRGAGICAVNSAVAELRHNIHYFGLTITCRRLDKNTWAYQMERMA